MEPFISQDGVAAVLDLANVDTDQIIPKQFLKRVEREGFGQYLFFNWRFDAQGQPDPAFVLNHPRYAGATVLLAGENFGSGSSREHAPWALADYGFKVVVAPSFADIFKNNCLSIGLLTVELAPEQWREWASRVRSQDGYRIRVDLAAQTLTGSDGFTGSFAIDAQRKERLLSGMDDIALTLQAQGAIEDYEKSHAEPWRAAMPAGK